MIGIPYINDLFRAVLSKSKAIAGRFHICPRYGAEISADQLEQVLKDDVKPQTGAKYPLVLMMPPRMAGQPGQSEWTTYRLVLFFLTTSYLTSDGQVKWQNKATLTSTHSIDGDWHDMHRAGHCFIQALQHIDRHHKLHSNFFRLGLKSQKEFLIDPISMIGLDNVSGIRLEFQVQLFPGCDLEDYNLDDLLSLTVPVIDSHPEHKL
ncbi:hypothetical protein SAMN05444266_101622 [Chitinophaga jiangningensis]|uniref:Uncharacterized protein n=1 Tax=Chitinophaga jiangningensis TaxID=1419482 RepID=A0A1M6WH37_9BACT|nr:hypothetical protein [Chitinophaga jiangningensis]SHK92991.1 hypothetical protein SAMN05444266_101622 [Chitinophaga jiangningensis]